MSAPPTGLRALRDRGVLEITWPDAPPVDLSFFDVRCACPCAVCIDEITGAALLRPETVPKDIAPTELGYSGHYALRITWSDGHASGLYTWDRLRALSERASSVE